MSDVIDAEIVKEKPVANNVVPFTPNLPLSRASLDSVSANRRIVSEFIQSQLREEIDFGIIKGTLRPSLFKPGSEKFCKLFNLTIKCKCVDKTIDRENNFALFTYRATVISSDGRELAQVEGSCNSQEKKYKFADNVCDILNTLMKMAQKRAKVGAVIEAVGASDFYTQDIDDDLDAGQLGIKPPPQRVEVKIPKVTAAKSTGTAPLCCNKPMMVSKFDESVWYCVECKRKEPR